MYRAKAISGFLSNGEWRKLCIGTLLLPFNQCKKLIKEIKDPAFDKTLIRSSMIIKKTT